MGTFIAGIGVLFACFVTGVGVGIGIAVGLEIVMRLSGDGRTVILTFARNKRTDVE